MFVRISRHSQWVPRSKVRNEIVRFWISGTTRQIGLKLIIRRVWGARSPKSIYERTYEKQVETLRVAGGDEVCVIGRITSQTIDLWHPERWILLLRVVSFLTNSKYAKTILPDPVRICRFQAGVVERVEYTEADRDLISVAVDQL